MVMRQCLLVCVLAGVALGAEPAATVWLPPLSEAARREELEREKKLLADLARYSSGEDYERALARQQAKLPPAPEGARVSLLLDKPVHLLGENVLVQFCIENAGEEPFKVDTGGDYRGTSRHTRFRVTAVGEDGEAVPDPDPHAANRCMGGMGGPRELKPGEQDVHSLPLIRYCRIERPGVYTIRVSHDLGWRETPERKRPVAEAKLELAMPTPEQARGVVDAMARLKNDGGVWGKRRAPYPDLTALAHPVYLPILFERAKGGRADAVQGMARIPTLEATRALLELLGHENPKVVMKTAELLQMRLPSPPGTQPSRRQFSYMERQREYFVPRCWRAELAPAVREHARRLLLRGDPDGLSRGAELLTSVGSGGDIVAVARALDQAAAALEPTPSEGHARPSADSPYERARRPCETLMRLVGTLARDGFHLPYPPSTPGEALIFARGIGLRQEFRPKGWQAELAKALQHPLPFVRRTALENLPQPVPEPYVKLIGECLGNADRDVLVAACKTAVRAKATELRGRVLDVVRNARDHWLLWQADDAARALGGRLESMRILAMRLDEGGIGPECMWRLINGFVTGTNGSSASGLNAADAPALKAQWLKFLQDHAEAVTAGKRFEIGDPALTPDLFPKGFRFHRDGKPDWP